MYEPKNLFLEDDRSRAAQAKAMVEVERLNKLLRQHGFPKVSKLELPTLITYIKAKELGLLDMN